MRRGPDGGRVYHPAPTPLGLGQCPFPSLPCDAHCQLVLAPETLSAMGLGGWQVFNPSVLERYGHLLVSLRLFHPAVWTAAGSAGCALVLGQVGPGITGLASQDVHRARGGEVEDARLFQDAQGVGFVAGVTARGKSTMHVGRLDERGDVCALAPIPSPRAIEKNWMPESTSEDGLRLVYTCAPLQTAFFRDGVMAPAPADMPGFDPAQRGHDGMRGGSQLVRDGQGYLAVVHERTAHLGYVHRFARFDAALSRVAFGRPWVLQHWGIEFVAGLARHEGKWVLAYGIADRQAWLSWVSDETVKEYGPDEG